MTIQAILRHWTDSPNITNDEIEELLTEELNNYRWPATSLPTITERAELFIILWPQVREKCRELGIESSDLILLTFWRLWLPLAIQLRDSKKPFIQGILAPQGTGKTTLTVILRLILEYFALKAVELSIDDLYKTYQDRLKLRETDPRLIWRGPPGTHDVDLGITVLDQIRRGETPITLPRFNKILHQGQGDRISPETVDRVDILLFEGWFIGARPVETTVFECLLDPVNTPDDRQFARTSNERLQTYLPLWERIDRLLILYPRNYRWSLQWRKEAELSAGMKDTEIEEFVKYFWKALHPDLFLTPLTHQADLVVELNQDRSISHLIHNPIQ